MIVLFFLLHSVFFVFFAVFRWQEEKKPESSQVLKVLNTLLLSVVIIGGYLYGSFILVAIYIVSMKDIKKNDRRFQVSIDSVIERDQL